MKKNIDKQLFQLVSEMFFYAESGPWDDNMKAYIRYSIRDFEPYGLQLSYIRNPLSLPWSLDLTVSRLLDTYYICPKDWDYAVYDLLQLFFGVLIPNLIVTPPKKNVTEISHRRYVFSLPVTNDWKIIQPYNFTSTQYLGIKDVIDLKVLQDKGYQRLFMR